MDFERFLGIASVFWRNNLPASDGDRWIVVEALHHQSRNVLRNLLFANALRRVEPARILVLTGTDEHWYGTIWADFNVEKVERLCEAFHVAEVIDVHALADRFTAAPDGEPPAFDVAGERLVPSGEGPVRWSGITPGKLDASTYASVCRLDLVPRLDPEQREDARYTGRGLRSAAFAGIYETLFRELDTVAFVTSHVDYDPWGLGVEAALRHEVPVVHVQSTGSLKAYTLFPEKVAGEPEGFRAEMTREIGRYFDDHVWANREIIRPSAELVAWRSRSNLGRPSWWRFGASAVCELRTPGERAQFRAYTMERLGLDPALPVVTVFNHAVSDALGTNRESFGDLAGWFEETVRAAPTLPAANWLVLDHPDQDKYDSTGHFASVAEAHASFPNMVFMSSKDLSKNALWSMTDLGLTVRGSVSNELPAFGIPVLQTGWSEWSSCSVSTVVTDRESYWKTLTSFIEALARGESLITAEQVERARLWLWFYRGAADVASLLVPHWDLMPEQTHFRALEINMRSVESDGDPLFSAVRRMWNRREPFLTRFDLTSAEALSEALPADPRG
ncbi:hypothetical protein GCM10010468_56150 [Actinocorallia longicatena]|uniref:Uncharacterized protein n=1 Tax=Actinocorallia longicatena TaxID=111803 RepID=A0ABP6QIP9_9ACTN